MISFEINGEKVTKLYLDGNVVDIYKELYRAVEHTLDKLELRDKDGEKRPLNEVLLEFGQFLAMLATMQTKRSESNDQSAKG